MLKDKQPELAPEEVMAGGVRHDDMCGVSRQFALLKLEDALRYWTTIQSEPLSNVLRLPTARFMHAFCTVVWPIELMAREVYDGHALLTVNLIRKLTLDYTTSGTNDYERWYQDKLMWKAPEILLLLSPTSSLSRI
jgi:hypothetical protein